MLLAAVSAPPRPYAATCMPVLVCGKMHACIWYENACQAACVARRGRLLKLCGRACMRAIVKAGCCRAVECAGLQRRVATAYHVSCCRLGVMHACSFRSVRLGAGWTGGQPYHAYSAIEEWIHEAAMVFMHLGAAIHTVPHGASAWRRRWCSRSTMRGR